MCPTIFNVDFKQVFDRMVVYLVGIFLFLTVETPEQCVKNF